MKKLDFSKLEGISYRGFDGAEARENKDKLIDRGYSVIEGEGGTMTLEAPPPPPEEYTAPSPPEEDACTQQSEPPKKRKVQPFTALDTRRDYRAIHRAVFEYHKRHTPVCIDPNGLEEYFQSAIEDMVCTAEKYGNDLFIQGLLVEVYRELEREYLLLRNALETGIKAREAEKETSAYQ